VHDSILYTSHAVSSDSIPQAKLRVFRKTNHCSSISPAF